MYEENSYKLKIDWKTLIIRAILVLLFIKFWSVDSLDCVSLNYYSLY